MYAFFALRMAKGEIIALLAAGFLLVVTQFAKLTKIDASAAYGKERQMTPDKNVKCAHPNCSCQGTGEKYCSPQCEAMEKTPDIDCRCGHSGCKGKAH